MISLPRRTLAIPAVACALLAFSSSTDAASSPRSVSGATRAELAYVTAAGTRGQNTVWLASANGSGARKLGPGSSTRAIAGTYFDPARFEVHGLAWSPDSRSRSGSSQSAASRTPGFPIWR